MRRQNCCTIAAAAGAFGLGVFLVLTCSFQIALVLAAMLLILLAISLLRW